MTVLRTVAPEAEVDDGGPARAAHYLEALAPIAGARFDARLASIATNLAELDADRPLRPYVLADAWRVPRSLVAAALLAATAAGIVVLEWTAVCPRCGWMAAPVRRLGDIPRELICGGCRRPFEPAFERDIEVTFTRVAGSPGPAPILPGGARTSRVALPPGAFAVEIEPGRRSEFFVATGLPSGEVAVRFDDAAIAIEPPLAGPGQTTLRLINAGSRPLQARLIEPPTAERRATAASITALDEFALLVPDAVLGPQVDLAAHALSLLFCDLPARAHDVEPLRALIAAYRGALVLNVGDALLATFVEPVDAFDAALRVAPLLARTAEGEVRVALRRGPCSIVREGDRLTAVGRPVNVTAALAYEATADAIAVGVELEADPVLAPRITARACGRGAVTLHGYPERVDVVRVRPFSAFELDV